MTFKDFFFIPESCPVLSQHFVKKTTSSRIRYWNSSPKMSHHKTSVIGRACCLVLSLASSTFLHKAVLHKALHGIFSKFPGQCFFKLSLTWVKDAHIRIKYSWAIENLALLVFILLIDRYISQVNDFKFTSPVNDYKFTSPVNDCKFRVRIKKDRFM